MANCLVKTLKVVVNNDNLPFFDSIEIVLNQTAVEEESAVNRGIKLQVVDDSSPCIVHNIGGVFLDGEGASLGKTVTVNNYSSLETLLFSTDTEKIYICNRANIKEFRSFVNQNKYICNVNIESLAGCTNLEELRLYGYSQRGNLSNLPVLASLKNLRLNSSSIYGSIEYLKDDTKLVYFNIQGTTGISGDFVSLAPYRNSGDVIDFTTVSAANNKVTCNGTNVATVSSHVNITFDGQGGVSFAAYS